MTSSLYINKLESLQFTLCKVLEISLSWPYFAKLWMDILSANSVLVM